MASYLGDLFNYDYGMTDITNNYALSNGKQTIQEYINNNKYLLNNVSNYINKVYSIINNIKVNDDIEQTQKQKVLQTIKIKGDKLIKSCNDFKMLLKIELVNFEPFSIIVNDALDFICDKNLNAAYIEQEIGKYKNDDEADDNLDNVDFDNPENDFSIIFIKNQKEYNDILKKYNIKK